MNDSNLELAGGLVPKQFLKNGITGTKKLEKKFGLLLSSRKMPERGWKDAEIEALLLQMGSMDSNNFAVGVGEREGRVHSSLVSKRCFGMAHGMGRSGNLAGAQPKAAGSSLVVSLAQKLVVQSLQIAGDSEAKCATVMPVATGMALFMCIASLQKDRPLAKHVVWCRCDQNSAIKAVALAGLRLEVVEMKLVGEALETDLEAVKERVNLLGPDNVLCVLSTTSCFAPRVPDKVDDIARFCKERDVPHLINNAYGVQSKIIMKLIGRAQRVGRVDGYVQSLDKNWMVPVGGAVICGRVADIAGSLYPGRASSGPLLDLFITLLSMGVEGWTNLLNQREELMEWFSSGGPNLELKRLETPANPISVAFVVNGETPKMLGSMLFTRGLTGHRVCEYSEKKSEDGQFVNWGQHCNAYSPAKAYMTIAVSIGLTKDQLQTAISIINKTIKKL